MIIPYITTKQQEIPKLLYKYRFINRLQIQQFMGHKDKRRINSWLKELKEKHYVEKVVFEDETPFEAKSKLSIYSTGINGIRFLKTLKNTSDNVIKKLYKDGKREKPFINRSLLIAHTCLDLMSQNKSDNSCTFFTASDYAGVNSLFHFLTKLNDHAPDLVYFDKNNKKSYCLVTVIDETLPRYRIKRRVKDYLDFYMTGVWERNTNKPFPVIKIVAPTKEIMIYTKRFIKKVVEDAQAERFLVELTFAQEVKKNGLLSDIWEKV
jgi:hypothetical protein